jgi:uncharacterized protein with GYD domain
MLFMITGNLTQKSLQGFIANPGDRREPAARLVAAMGGTLQQMYQTPSGTALLIVEVPDATVLTAISTTVQAIDRLTNVRHERLLSTAEFADGIRLAQKNRDAAQ